MADEQERDELIAGAASDALDAEGRRRFAALRRDDPGVDAEVESLRDLLAGLAAEPGWIEERPSDLLRARVAAIATAPAAGARIRRGRLIGLAAACVAVGVLAGAVVAGAVGGSTPPRAGAPGELGALEHVEFEDRAGVDVDGDVVAHTWGTETLLHASGLQDGATYSVVLIGSDGREAGSGSFRGTPGTVDCAVNAALLRDEVAEVQVRQGGRVVSTADLPAIP